MGTLFSAFDIARSGMQVAQVQLDVTGHNIANATKPGFSRQRVELVSRVPIDTPAGQIGRGVAIARIARLRDPFLDGLFRRQAPNLAAAELRAEFFQLVEDVFLEPSENGLSGRLNAFFDALNQFAGNVESQALRQGVLNEAGAIANLFRETVTRLDLLRTNLNDTVRGLVPQVNSLAERIALLNDRIRVAEGGGRPANDLRDDRDVLIDELSRIVGIFVRERQDGQADILIGGDELVTGGTTRVLQAVPNALLDPERNDLVEVRFADNGQLAAITNGEIAAALEMRDVTIVGIDARMDILAASIIEQINRIHTQGNGLSNLSDTVDGTNPISGLVPLDMAGLPFAFQAGSFDVTVFDSAGNVTATGTVAVTPGVTTIADLTFDIANISPDLSAGASVNDELSVTAAPGTSFVFSNDTSGILTALGFNALFTGFDARSIGVNAAIAANPSLLASAFDPDPAATGDNSAALAMAGVRNGLFLDNGTSTINDFYEGTIAQIGIDARANLGRLEVERTFVQTFEQRRQETSGVSLDEEVTNLLLFQRAFEASARVVTVTDRMLETLLNVIQ